jgi:hypothetical protein
MNGKTYLIKGTINGKAFMIWSARDAELELDFEDAAKVLQLMVTMLL